MFKRILSVVICVSLIIGLIPISFPTGRVQGEVLTDFEIIDGILIKYNGSNKNIIIHQELGIIEVGFMAFAENPKIESVIISDIVSVLSDCAFKNCVNLRSIIIPNNVIEIGDEAFDGCNELIIYGEMGSYAEAYAEDNDIQFIITPLQEGLEGETIKIQGLNSSLEGDFSFDASTGTITGYKGTKKEIEIPSKLGGIEVKNISNGAFKWKNITHITIPESVNNIEQGAFDYCNDLEEITVAEESEYYSDIDGVLFNKAKTNLIKYPNGKLQTDYSIPNSVTTIGNSAFYGCRNLISLIIPNSVTSMGASVLEECYKLTEVSISNSITNIKDRAFSGCYNLADITIPDSVTTIGDYAFSWCDSLKDIVHTR